MVAEYVSSFISCQMSKLTSIGNEDYRQWSPCISTNEWHDLLCRTGFSGTDIAIPDFLDPICHEFGILLSTAVERLPAPVPDLPQYPDILIVLTECSLIQNAVANKIKEDLISRGASACDIVSIPNASAVNDLARRFCIFLNELEKPLLSNLDSATFTQLQQIITTATGVVLNSLSGKGLVASWECIAPFGRFIEIGKRDIHGRGKLPMFQFDRNALFTAIEFGSIINERPIIVQKCLQAVLNLVADRKLRAPQSMSVYGVSEIESAFRHFQSGRNSGKMVIDMRQDELVLVSLIPCPILYKFMADLTTADCP